MKPPFLVSATLFLILFTQCQKRQVLRSGDGLQDVSSIQSLRKISNSLEMKEDVAIRASMLPADFKETLGKIVQPARELLLQVLEEDNTGTYTAFKQDVNKLKELKTEAEKREQLYRIRKYYYGFISEAWEKAAIDEAHYREAIMKVLPDSLKAYVVFDSFLNFKIEYAHTKDPLPSEKPDPPPAPEPTPELQCYNAIKSIFDGSDQQITLAAGATAHLLQYTGQPSSYYYLFANAAAFPIYGIGRGTCWAHGNITIPGTFMDDDKLIRIRKHFTWDAMITAFAGGLASCANGYYWSGEGLKRIEVWAPVIWFSELQKEEDIFEEQLVDKRQLQIIRCGAEISNFAFTEGLGYANSTGTLTINNWTLCEELKK